MSDYKLLYLIVPVFITLTLTGAVVGKTDEELKNGIFKELETWELFIDNEVTLRSPAVRVSNHRNYCYRISVLVDKKGLSVKNPLFTMLTKGQASLEYTFNEENLECDYVSENDFFVINNDTPLKKNIGLVDLANSISQKVWLESESVFKLKSYDSEIEVCLKNPNSLFKILSVDEINTYEDHLYFEYLVRSDSCNVDDNITILQFYVKEYLDGKGVEIDVQIIRASLHDGL